jgi:UDP-glucose 4-epimerase
MRKNDIKNIIFASSSAMYGDTKVIPTPEDLPDIRPSSMYAASKVSNEAFIHAYCNIYGMKAWMFRFSHVIGRHEHRGVIIDLIAKLNKNVETLEILGDGNQGKSFFDVSDCVRGLIEIPKKDNNKTVAIYNLANTDYITIKEVAKIVCEEIGVSPVFKYTGGVRGWSGDTPNTILDITRALKVGWKPTYDCRTAVRNTVNYLFERK